MDHKQDQHQDAPGMGRINRRRIPEPPYAPNEEEKRVLKECQRESFMYRALPMALLTGSGTFYLIQRGILTTKSRFGPIPKVIFGTIFGYFFGKLSYVSVCKNKLLQLENSPIADMIRKGKTPGAIAASAQFAGLEMLNPKDSMAESGNSTRLNSDYSSNLDIDTSHRPDLLGDDYDQNHVVNPVEDEEAAKKRPQMTMTYDQLRKQNRDKMPQQYQEVVSDHQNKQTPPTEETSTLRSPQSTNTSDVDELSLGRSKKMKKNIYGDVVSD